MTPVNKFTVPAWCQVAARGGEVRPRSALTFNAGSAAGECGRVDVCHAIKITNRNVAISSAIVDIDTLDDGRRAINSERFFNF